MGFLTALRTWEDSNCDKMALIWNTSDICRDHLPITWTYYRKLMVMGPLTIDNNFQKVKLDMLLSIYNFYHFDFLDRNYIILRWMKCAAKNKLANTFCKSKVEAFNDWFEIYLIACHKMINSQKRDITYFEVSFIKNLKTQVKTITFGIILFFSL